MTRWQHIKLHKRIERAFADRKPTWLDRSTCWICGTTWHVPITTAAQPQIVKERRDGKTTVCR